SKGRIRPLGWSSSEDALEPYQLQLDLYDAAEFWLLLRRTIRTASRNVAGRPLGEKSRGGAATGQYPLRDAEVVEGDWNGGQEPRRVLQRRRPKTALLRYDDSGRPNHQGARHKPGDDPDVYFPTRRNGLRPRVRCPVRAPVRRLVPLDQR